ncbi:MAG TPA: DoxX family protein [Longimicrobium sp.]|jgi:putative oxidoreductase|nr:DoxX family protein [Gemmatimonadaceae bacterium]HVH11733.1 DoxX family protein [Longimicrobium sp.]
MANFFMSRFEPQLLSMLRIVIALNFMQHGVQKLFGLLGGTRATLMTLPWFAGVLEFFGGLLVLIGLFTRPVAFVLAGLMAVAYYMAHRPQGFFPILNQGEPAVLFAFVFLYLSAAGPGPWSIDAMRGGGRLADRSRV